MRSFDKMDLFEQKDFNATIGELDHCMSQLLVLSDDKSLSRVNRQTLVHHAEDMIGAGHKILANLGDEALLLKKEVA